MTLINPQEKPAVKKMSFAAVMDEIHNYFVYVCREKFGWTTVNNMELSSGEGHVVIRFEKNGKRMVFRVARHSASQQKRNLLAYGLVGELGLMPAKIYHDPKCIIEDHMDGQALNSGVSDNAIIELAQKLSRMHSMPAQGYGPLDTASHGTYEHVSSYYEKLQLPPIDYSEVDLTSEEVDFLERARASLTTLPEALLNAKTCIGHGDLWRNNILVDQDHVHVIDWDRIGAYPVEHDLVFLVDAQFSDVQKQVFYTHYQIDVNLDLVCWFSLRRVFLNTRLNLKKKIAEIKKYELLGNE